MARSELLWDFPFRSGPSHKLKRRLRVTVSPGFLHGFLWCWRWWVLHRLASCTTRWRDILIFEQVAEEQSSQWYITAHLTNPETLQHRPLTHGTSVRSQTQRVRAARCVFHWSVVRLWLSSNARQWAWQGPNSAMQSMLDSHLSSIFGVQSSPVWDSRSETPIDQWKSNRFDHTVAPGTKLARRFWKKTL